MQEIMKKTYQRLLANANAKFESYRASGYETVFLLDGRLRIISSLTNQRLYPGSIGMPWMGVSACSGRVRSTRRTLTASSMWWFLASAGTG